MSGYDADALALELVKRSQEILAGNVTQDDADRLAADIEATIDQVDAVALVGALVGHATTLFDELAKALNAPVSKVTSVYEDLGSIARHKADLESRDD